jgi:2,4-dienoyl-CoA reductase (NADPH2)
VSDNGLHISFGPKRAATAAARGGQRRGLRRSGAGARSGRSNLRRNGIDAHIIGGAAFAAELDAKRAIKQGTELAARL